MGVKVMCGKPRCSKAISKVVNEIVKTIDNMPYNSIIDLLKNKKIPYPRQLLSFFIEKNYLIKIDGKYTWAIEHPIYHEELNDVFKREREKNNNLNEESAIKFLKNLGYKILKPVTQYEEI